MSVRRTIGAATLAVIASLTFIAGSAQAVDVPVSAITATPSDSTPASGQTFYVSGVFTAEGKPADHDWVKVQSWSNGRWVQLTGAEIRTTSTGTYQMRIILQAKGDRLLRTIGVVPGPARDAFKRFSVTVH